MGYFQNPQLPIFMPMKLISLKCCAPRSGFEREARGNLEMAYFPLLVEQEIQSELTVPKA